MSDIIPVESVTREGERFVVRPCGAADSSPLLRYFETVSGESNELMFGADGRGLSPEAEAEYIEQISRANSLLLVATIHNEIVGSLTLTSDAKASTVHTGDVGVTVLRKHWNKGIARQLFTTLLAWVARESTIRKLNLRVRASNARAATLYACLGFRVEGRQSRMALEDDRFQESLLMGRCIDSPVDARDDAIRRARDADVDAAWNVMQEAREELDAHGIHQWHLNYPTRDTIREDIVSGRLFAIDREGRIDAVVTLDDQQDPLYAALPWTVHGRALVVHRLCVRPSAQGSGLGRRLMSFAEDFAEIDGARCIRLDAYSENAGAVRLYERRGYRSVGSLRFPHRVSPFVCFELATRWPAVSPSEKRAIATDSVQPN